MLTLSQAASYCDTTLHVIRKRADRGTLATVKRDGVRYVTREALEAAGLIPDAELVELRRENSHLRDELATHRLLTQKAQAAADVERAAHEHAVNALAEQRAIATAAQARAGELEQLERDLAAAGPIKAWRLARARRVMERQQGSITPATARVHNGGEPNTTITSARGLT